MRRLSSVIRDLAALLVGACLFQACGAEPAVPQRVVLITLDTLRYDSFADGEQAASSLMPTTRRLAAGGVSFDNFYANTSTTQPSHASLFTGLNPWRHGVTRNGMLLDEGLPNLPSSLQRAGFGTHAVVSSFPLHSQFGFARGFDHYEDSFDVPYVQVWEGRPVEQGRFFSLADSVTEQALAALDAAEQGDQFFWFHYFDPHDPYGDAAEGAQPIGVGALLNAARGASGPGAIEAELAAARALYEADVRAMDRALGSLFERLEEDAERFETHIILTADHGESFGELGAIGHGKRVTREQVQVPLLIISPGLAPGARSDAASLVDLAKTILGLAGVPDPGFSGRDLLGEEAAESSPVFGMRRSFAKPKREVTADGKLHALTQPWFFMVQGNRLITGDESQALEGGDRGLPLGAEEGLLAQRLFSTLAAQAAEGPRAIELTDAAVQDALGALGYLDAEDKD